MSLPVAGRPQPLHDPDPYSTPPYGAPGPWAPAPPVQHPGGTSASRAVTEARTAVPGTHVPPVPGSAPVPSGTPASPGADTDSAPFVPPPASFTAAASRPTDTASPSSAAPPAPAPVPRADASAPDASTPLVTPAVPIAPHPSGNSASAALTSPGLPDTPLVSPDPAPTSVGNPHPAPDPHPHPTPDPHPAPDPNPAPTPTPAPTPLNPWHRYDPWAPRTPAPLHQTGASTSSSNRPRPRTLLTSALVLVLLAGGVGGVIGAYIERGGPGGDIVLPQAAKEDTGRAGDTVAGIAARALPSVVTLRVAGDEESGTGTGIVLDDRGDILTNNHVVRPGGGGGAISVRFSGGQTVKGDVVGRDVGYDLAVVRVHGVRGLRPMPLGNSDNVRVGDPVVAIGAPFGLDNTVTAGIVSARERPITTGGDASDGSDVSYVDALQTDAPINPGNSGGPLLDARGLLVGVNSAIRTADEQDGNGDGGGDGSSQSGSVGLGFAIPVNQAKRVAEELINDGKATHPVIGVTLDLDYAGDGARVAKQGTGPGAAAGLRAGDVITQVDGVPVHSGDELVVRTRAHRPGDHLRLTLRRGGKDMTVSLALGSATGD
ncbi:trypsin-like peptidase domain-containing protein [Streptomyces sp. NPDC096013]|uniref:S1C family serine protease n=1 Tax=Streptomyces sp. NPDC096013 TaxID=3366069 RepID=UPI003822FFEF